MRKLAITIGADAKGELKALYLGDNYAKALGVLDDPPKGIVEIFAFRNPLPWRRKLTREGAARQQAVLEASQKKSAANYAKAKKEAEAKAKGDAEAQARAIAEAQAKAAQEQKDRKTKAEELAAQVHEDLAAEHRENLKQSQKNKK